MTILAGTLAETDRLIIRNWRPETDAAAAFQLYSDPEVTHFLKTKVTSLEEAQQLLQRWQNFADEWQNGAGFWAIALKATGEVIGTVILIQLRDHEQRTADFEIGWHLRRSSWGQGYATEAATALLHYGFQTLNLPVIYAIARPDNTASLRVMQRLGMIHLGRTDRYYNLELELFKLDAPTQATFTAGNMSS